MNIIQNTLSAMALIMLTSLPACIPESDLSSGSNLDTAAPTRNTTDIWIVENFTEPYNIEVVYRWTESLADQSRYLYPPKMDNVQPALNIIKKLWIEPYCTVDPDLVSRVAPRQIILVGGRNVNPSGTFTLGLAEAGKRISLFEIDLVNKESREDISRFIHTIQHEYMHILNQTKPFNEEDFGTITPSGYTSQWYNESEGNSRTLGFITSYARADVREDFAEMASNMLQLSRNEWNDLLKTIPEEGRSKIARKEQFMMAYYKSEFGIDLYRLQENVYKAILKLIK